ncbi:Transcription initiation factor TFIID subunit 7 [Schistosoma japonicum]|nr:Transcription initiation factor TFIID subunit 7 [Schistosoma japonicum]
MTGKLTSDSNYDLEQQFILRMTDTVAAQNLAADIDAGISFKENFTVEFKPDMRHTIVRYNGQVYQGQIMDLPCIIESLKTTDRKNFYKTANICQMMICTQGDETGPLRGTAAYLDNRPGSRNKTFDIGHENREFQFLHGITPPLKNVLHRRFRKTRRKRFVDMPKIEKEVKQLLRADLQAMNVKWEVIWTDPPAPTVRSNTNNKSSLHNNESDRCSDVEINNQQRTADDELEEDDDEDGGRAYAIDHRDVFGEISSSSIGSSSDSDDNSSNDSSLHGNDNRRRQQRREGGGGDGKRDSSSDHESDNDERVSICGSKEKEINQSSLRNRSTDNLLEVSEK